MTTTLGWRYIVLFYFSPSIIFDVNQEKNEKKKNKKKKKDGFAYRNVKETRTREFFANFTFAVSVVYTVMYSCYSILLIISSLNMQTNVQSAHRLFMEDMQRDLYTG